MTDWAGQNRRFSDRTQEPGIDQRLSSVRGEVSERGFFEQPWDLFCPQRFPGWPRDRVAEVLATWQRDAGVQVKFIDRNIDYGRGKVPIVVVQFFPRS